MSSAAPGYIILFDGVCNLCNNSVQFILKRDKKRKFLFGSLQSEAGKEALKGHQLPFKEMSTIILIEGNKIYTRSTGVLRVLKHLGRGWQLLYVFIIVPPFIRDGIYKWVSRNRYKWFGKREVCRLPTPEERSRFID